MQLGIALTLCTYLVASALAAAAPRTDVARRDPVEQHLKRDSNEYSDLWKRRGGGGGGGGRGGGGGGGSGSGSTGGGGRGSSTSSSGGRTTTGSGPAPAYGGGRYYGGGAAVPYKAGQRSPKGISPLFIGAGVGLAFWPGVWLTGAYLYPYPRPHTFYNASSQANETKPITCGCVPDLVCGCDENDDPQYLNDIIGNGTNLNTSLVTVGVQDGVQRILINGTLPNGTTAAGGDEDPFGNSAGSLQMMLRNAGWWPVVAIVSAMVFTA